LLPAGRSDPEGKGKSSDITLEKNRFGKGGRRGKAFWHREKERDKGAPPNKGVMQKNVLS